eukprot:6885592-Alexandrium_andersonii.AAC.1
MAGRTHADMAASQESMAGADAADWACPPPDPSPAMAPAPAEADGSAATAAGPSAPASSPTLA